MKFDLNDVVPAADLQAMADGQCGSGSIEAGDCQTQGRATGDREADGGDLAKPLLLQPGQQVGQLTLNERVATTSSTGKRTVFWRCVCECSKDVERLILENSLRRGATTSCGCYRRFRLFNEGQLSALRTTIRGYKRADRKAGREYGLHEHEFLNLALQPCWYCDKPPIRIAGRRRKGSAEFMHEPIRLNGLDRIDASLGHIPGNVIPCCRFHNTLRGRQGFLPFLKRRSEELYQLVDDLVADGVAIRFDVPA